MFFNGKLKIAAFLPIQQNAAAVILVNDHLALLSGNWITIPFPL